MQLLAGKNSSKYREMSNLRQIEWSSCLVSEVHVSDVAASVPPRMQINSPNFGKARQPRYPRCLLIPPAHSTEVRRVEH